MKNDPTPLLLRAKNALESVGTFIFVFTSGEEASHSYEPLSRSPLPDINWPIDESLAAKLVDAFKINPSIHDGAMVFNKGEGQSIYRASHWSCRLLPPKVKREPSLNLGVAWNSCAAMSCVDGVDFVVLYSKSTFTKFDAGYSKRLIKNSNKI